MNNKIFSLGFVGLLFIAIFGAAVLMSNDNGEVYIDSMTAANQLYSAGHYPEAIQIYEQILDKDIQDSAIYFNLGNAYFQSGDLGRAILNYQRAAKLDPRDGDIRANLELARSMAIDQFTITPGGPLNILAGLSGRWLSFDEVAMIALGAWLALVWVLIAWRGMSSSGGVDGLRYAAIILLFMVLISGASLGSRIYLESNQPDGVIVAPVVAVHDQPVEAETTDINLYSGTEVKLLEHQDQWIKFSVPGDTMGGWVPLDAVELIAL